MLKCSISSAEPGPALAVREVRPVLGPAAASRSSITGLCSTSFCSRSTLSFVVALISRHWHPRGTCGKQRLTRPTFFC